MRAGIFLREAEVIFMPTIRPSADLRNKYNEISEYYHTNSEPVFITEILYGDDLLGGILESLSRLGRSTKDLIELVELFERKKVHLVSLKANLPLSALRWYPVQTVPKRSSA